MNPIDIHCHVVPERFPAYAGKGRDVPWPSMSDAHACHKHIMISGKLYRTVSDGCWSVARRLEDMQAMRVGRQALSPMPELLSYWLPLEDAKVLIRYINDQIGEMMAQAPGRFVGLGAVPLQDLDAAVAELEYVMQSLKFAGIEIASHVNGKSIGEPHFAPFFREVERRGAAVFVHALRPAGVERIVGPLPEQAVGFPGDIALAAASMITGGTASRLPAMRIAFSHGGGAMPILLPRLEHGWKMIAKASETLTESPTTTARRFYYDDLVFDPAAIRFLVEQYGATQVLLGTDYPFAMGDTDPLGTLGKTGLDEATIERITAGNAARFLGL
jgi:aminocarboxymuconate-semialdehyde decarboxylase